MRNLIRFYYQNKQKIWKVILIIALILVVIQILNRMAENKTIESSKAYNNNYTNTTIENKGNTIISSNNSLVSGEQVRETSLKDAQEVINNFIEACNSGEVKKAYEILTEECKEKLYPTLEVFQNNYWKGLFNQNKICIIENWAEETYKVTLEEDMLATGNATNQKKYIEYMTIVYNGDTYQLNINNYIGRKQIGKTTSQDDIEITIISKDTYMDYEEYNIQINNQSNNAILLDDLSKTGTIYLQDSNNIKYNAYNNKLLKSDMIIEKGMNKDIQITFSNAYIFGREYKNIVFSKLVFDYKNNAEKQETREIFINL